MIHILLLILKIIGIVLLVILSLALLILFFPVTYRVKGELGQKDYCVKVTAGWLFGIIHFGLLKDKTTEKYALRVFGIPVKKYPKKEKHKKQKAYKEQKKSHEEAKARISKQPERDFASDTGTEKTTGTADYENGLMTDSSEKDYTGREETSENSKDAEEKKKIIDKITGFIKKVTRFFKKAAFKVKCLLKNIEETKDKIIEIKKFISANTTKEACRYTKKIAIKILKYIFPKKIRGNIHFGFETPDLTGKTLGYIAIGFSNFHINPEHIKIEPDFEHKVLEGNIKIKGRIMTGVIGIYLLKLYTNKEIRSIINKFS